VLNVLRIWNVLKKLFLKVFLREMSSREEAKGRLHLVLAHDRSGLDGAKLQELRREIALVISRYVEIEPDSVEIEIERLSREDTQLIVSSPLRAR
jgi:cell division topological specificity factor